MNILHTTQVKLPPAYCDIRANPNVFDFVVFDKRKITISLHRTCLIKMDYLHKIA